MDADALSEINNLNGVVGITLTDTYGELLSSTIDDEQLNEFIAFLPGIIPVIEDGISLGRIQRVVLKGSHENNLAMFVDAEQSLTVQSEPRSSIQVLVKQVMEII
jgi:predicted regulator of Ras-like GTPase activity (Roadblock/LC7/MglB family)